MCESQVVDALTKRCSNFGTKPLVVLVEFMNSTPRKHRTYMQAKKKFTQPLVQQQ